MSRLLRHVVRVRGGVRSSRDVGRHRRADRAPGWLVGSVPARLTGWLAYVGWGASGSTIGKFGVGRPTCFRPHQVDGPRVSRLPTVQRAPHAPSAASRSDHRPEPSCHGLWVRHGPGADRVAGRIAIVFCRGAIGDSGAPERPPDGDALAIAASRRDRPGDSWIRPGDRGADRDGSGSR